MSRVLIRQAELLGQGRRDVRLERGRIAAIAERLDARASDDVLDARGGVLLPGLHDHHIHLFSLAAAQSSLDCGPPAVIDERALAHALATAPGEEWIRGVAYHESVAGALDRARLDALGPKGRPVRIQHRSGALWIMNSAALDALAIDGGDLPEGVECDAGGRPTGRIYYQDGWLRERLGAAAAPSLRALGTRLASWGVTGVTDATPDRRRADFVALEAAVGRGEFKQRLVAMSSDEACAAPGTGVEVGPLKIMLREAAGMDFEGLRGRIAAAHARALPVAIHCVTRAELVMAVEAIRAAGCEPGDRIEHASVAPPELVTLLAELELCVVTQPVFLWERGDVYAREVESRDQPWLYRGRGFLDAGVPLAAGSDAPYGDPDPWISMRAAVERRSRGGLQLGVDEALSPERALALFTTSPGAPGGAPREVAVGGRADLCLLDRPWSVVRNDLTSRRVIATLRDAAWIWRRTSA